jgi:hypothetical protein
MSKPMSLNLEETDLGGIASDLRRSFADRPPTGYLLGKTAFRDAIVKKLDCSALEAEQVVDTMIARGFLRYQGSPSEAIDGRQPWAIDPRPSMS